MRILMAIIELTLLRPVHVGASVDRVTLRSLANTAWVREVEPGTRRENVTDDRWNHQSFSWWLTVRRDGIGVLEIKPEWKNASISVADGKLRPRRLRAVTYTLERPQVQLLAGTQEQEDLSLVSMLFKIICRTDGKKLPF